MKDEITELARSMHEEYENAARLYGWETQEKSRVPFEELPPENAKVMLHMARFLKARFIEKSRAEEFRS